jgi:hypothetical protein
MRDQGTRPREDLGYRLGVAKAMRERAAREMAEAESLEQEVLQKYRDQISRLRRALGDYGDYSRHGDAIRRILGGDEE